MEQNEKLRNETSRRKPFVKALVAVLVAALAAFVLLPLTSTKALAETVPVSASSWSDLKDKISQANDGDVIEITNDIFAEGGTIAIDGKTVTIKAKAGGKATIYRKDGDTDFPMFTTSDDSAKLILGDGLTLSGKTCGGASSEGEFKVIWTNGASTDPKTETVTVTEGTTALEKDPSGWAPEEGYEFKGWKWKTPDGQEGSSVGTSTPNSTGDIDISGKYGTMTIVAQWEKPAETGEFKVVFHNGGTGDNAKQIGPEVVQVGESIIKNPADIASDWAPETGLVFKGWKFIGPGGNENNTAGNTPNTSTGDWKVPADKYGTMTLVAQWEKAGSGSGDLSYNDGQVFYIENNTNLKMYGPGGSYDHTYQTTAFIRDGGVYVRKDGSDVQVACYAGNLYLKQGSYSSYPNLTVETINGKTYLKEVSRSSKNGHYIFPKESGNGGFDSSTTAGNHNWNWGSTPTPYTSINPIAWAGDSVNTNPTPYTSTPDPSWEATTPQGCDDGDCKTYTKDDFGNSEKNKATADAPKGFFVQVDKGTVTLAGATLENFNTSTNKDDTPKHVAPVVASGSTAKFIVESGKIQNNIVGYVAKDGNSTNGANAIKQYIKGAAPNARRKNAPEPADGTKKRRGNDAGIDEGTPGSGITGTAGAVIYANGAKGEISGGSIGYNRADTGGIMVTDDETFVEIKDGADINHNVGVQFGGGTTVEQGGSIYMSGGEIHDNVAWFGGGAVFATQNGIDWLVGEKTMSKSERLDGNFTMAGGEIYGNNAFTRGGGFLVDSNGVYLESGVIRDNTSRVLGGGAYVMGDHPDYSYTLYIGSGQIYENEARNANAEENEPTVTQTAMSKKLNSATACKPLDSMFGNSMGGTSDDIADFQRINDGTGGGVWTCSYGSTVLDLDASKVYIHDNKASGSTGNTADPRTAKNKVGGQDFHSDNGGDGTLLMINADSTQWLDENTNEMYSPGEVDAEIRNLTNKGQSGNTTSGVQIFHNASRRGGGLAADGTFVFGDRQDVARVTAELDISKVWDESIPEADRKPVIIRVGVENNGKKAVVRDLELDGKEDLKTDEDAIHENAASGDEWSGGFNLPVTVDTEKGERITVFYIEGPDGTKYDPSKKAETDALAAALNGSDGSGFKLASDAKLTFTELVQTESGEYEETGEYSFDPGEVKVEDLKLTIKKVTRVNAQGVKEHVLSVNFARVPLKAPLRNEAPSEEIPGPEKYINKVVHTSLPAFDEKFEYAVLAYVPKDATEVVLTDTLEEPLEFVNKTKQTVLSGFYVLAENNSKGDGSGTVATTPRDKVEGNTLRVANGVKNGSRPGIDLNLTGNTVTLTLKEQFLQGIDTEDGDAIFKKEGAGRDYVWVMMTFDAQYNKDYYNLDKVKNNEENGDSWLENADDKSGGAALTYVQNNAEVRQNDNTKKYIIKLGDKYYNSSDAKEWTDVTKDADYYVARWDGNGDPKFNKLEGSAILDVTGIAIPDEAGITANGFVKDGTEEHSGTKNQAEYKLTRGNNPASDYKTNIVTVDAPVTKLEAEKKWKNADGSKATWPDGEESIEVEVIKVDEATQAEETVDTIVLTKAEPKKQSIELPKLDKATYRLEEVTVGGYTTASEDMAAADLTEGSESGKVFTNTKDVEEKPEIEKFVNEAVHKDITFDEEFTYDIVAYVTNDAEEVTITDTLNDVLEFVTTQDQVAVYDLETKNNHKVTNNVQANKVNNDATVAGGTAYEGATSIIDGQTLTVTIADATALQGHWIKVSFTAKIKDGLTIEDLQAEGVYKEVKGDAVNDFDADRAEPNKGNAPIKAGATHTGVPNDASYVINVNNEAKYNDRSNTVTVKPETTKVEVSKVWVLDGEELEAEDWPEGATVEVKLQSKKGEEEAQDVLDSENNVVTATLSSELQSYTFENLPVLTDVTYSVAEGTVENEGIYEIGKVEEVSDGVFKITNNGTTPEEEQPEIEKYVNKKDAKPEQRDGTVHTDLSFFDEVYTYDIQAYVTKDAKYVVVTDQLKDVLELVNASDIKIVAKDGAGDDGKTAPALSSTAGSVDVKTQCDMDLGTGTATANKLVFTFGSDAEDAEVLDFAGKWLQITFDAKIKDEYRSIDTLKEKGVNVWTTITNNEPVEDADTTTDFSGATAASHEGIINDSSYTINKIAGAELDNEWQYKDASNTVTVHPATEELEVKKSWIDGTDETWPAGKTVTFTLTKNNEPVSGKTITLSSEKKTDSFKGLPKLKDVTYGVSEVEIDGYMSEAEDPVVSDNKTTIKVTNTRIAPGSVEIAVNKELKKAGDAPAGTKNRKLKKDEFSFTIEGADDVSRAKLPENTTVKNAADGKVSFGTISYDTEGTYKYIIKEVVPDPKDPTISKYADNNITVTVKVEKDGDGLKATATYDEADKKFTNEYTDYTPASLVLTANKTVDGEAPAEGAVFTFELYEGETKKDTKTNADGGVITFDAIKYTKNDVGKTFNYTIKEVISEDAKNNGNKDASYTYDASEKKVTVNVSLNGTKVEAKIGNEVKTTYDAGTFNNTTITKQPDDISVEIEGIKVLENAQGNTTQKTLAADDFTFALYKVNAEDDAVADDAEPIETVKNDAAGKFAFAPISYKAEDAGKTFYYVVKELVGSDETITLTTPANNEYRVKVEVTREGNQIKTNLTDNKANVGTFTNTYTQPEAEPTQLTITAGKSLENAELKDDMFTFELREGKKLLESVKNKGENVTFKAIKYATAGEHTYTITEKKEKLDGIVYDVSKKTYKVNVLVNDDDPDNKFLYIENVQNNTVNAGTFTNVKGQVEKYINKDVDATLKNPKEVFTYDVIGYVAKNATRVTITDTLVNALEFVDAGGKPTTTGSSAVLKVQAQASNDHKVNGTVAAEGVAIEKFTAAIRDGKTLEVVVTDADELAKLQGKWVQVTFNARIKEDYANAAAVKADPDFKVIDNNKTVEGGAESHDGLTNKAEYEVELPNNGKVTDESNTVTVEPTYTKIDIEKKWQDAAGQDLDEEDIPTTDVTVNVLADGQAMDPAKTVTLKASENWKATVDGLPEYALDDTGRVPAGAEKIKYTISEVSEIEGFTSIINGMTVINKKDETPEEPEIEKYVNKKDATPEKRDGTVHTDLYAFDEVYTYDIQAYVTNDAKYVVVSDQLVEVLEFANDKPSVKLVVKDGEADGSAPKLSKEGEAPKDGFIVDENAWKDNKLVLTLGSEDNTEVLQSAGKWLQITFDAKIKDEYRTIDALKAKGVNVWTTITENDPLDDADVTEEFSEATAESHEGIINDSSYTINKKAGAEPGNEWEYSDKSNTVTVQPEMTEIEAKKLWYGSTDKWPEDIGSVTVGLFKLVFSINDNLEVDYKVEPVNGTIDHNGNLIPGGNKQAVYELTKDDSSKTIKVPFISNVIYYFEELKVDGTPVKSNGKLDSVGIANMGIFDIVASYMRPIFWIDIPDPETGETVTDFGIGTVVNNEKIETEKYVNNNVHADLVEFDKVFKYDILAYVSSEATEVTITDTLVDELEFAKRGEIDSKAVKAETAADAGIKVVTKEANDHKVNGTVSEGGIDVTDAEDLDINVDIENKTLTVTFAGEETDDVKPTVSVAGKWVQVTFYAKYTDAVIDAANIGATETVNNNGAVLNGVTPHDGTANKAHYTMNVGNDAKVDLDTNTVTVKPETTYIYVQKKLQAADGTQITTWPAGLTVDINVYKNVDGAVVDTIHVNSLDAVRSKELPKLIGVTYKADEVNIPEGYGKVGKVNGSGTETDPYVVTNKEGSFTVKISKTDLGGTEIEGADIKVYKKDEYGKTGTKPVKEWTSTDETYEFTLPAGDYIFVETVAPEGYKRVTTAIEFTVGKDGKVGLGTTTVDNGGKILKAEGEDNHLILQDAPVKVVIGKEDLAGKEVDGAVITVTGPEGFDSETWTSEAGKVHTLENLPAGDYELVEVNAPEGYDKVVTTIKFTVDKDGKVTVTNVREENGGGSRSWDDEKAITHIVLEDAPKGPEIEKYVNKDVHADIVEYDREFVYDVIAYVPMDATGITITDPLDDKLEFVSTQAEIEASAVAIAKSNHKATSVAVEKGKTRSVEETGTPVKATAVINGQLLTVNVENIGTEAGQQNIAGKSVRITFTAKIKANADGSYTLLKDEDLETVVKDQPVISELNLESGNKAGKHTGIKNGAKYTITTANDAEGTPRYPETPTNEVTVIPVSVQYNGTKAWEDKDGKAGVWPENINSVFFDLVKEEMSGGKVVNSSVVETIELTKANAFAQFQAVAKLIDVVYRVVEVPMLGYSEAAKEDINILGVPVTVITNRPEEPEIEKYINYAVHKDIDFDETFTYDILAWVTTDADTVTITDTLNEKIMKADDVVTVLDIGKDNNHKVERNKEGTVVNTDATVAVAGGVPVAGAKPVWNGKTLTVTIPDATDNRGHWVNVRFNVKLDISDTKEDGTKKTKVEKLAEAEAFYESVSAGAVDATRDEPNKGNDPVKSEEDHNGVPNKASYVIGVKKAKLDEKGKVVRDENGNVVVEENPTPGYSDESNTVTVKPEEVVVKISKADMDGTEIPGAEITLKDSEGNVVETWTSTDKSHETTLKPGTYTLVENVAPEGYKCVTTEITFTVDEDGKVTVETTKVENGKVEVREDGTLVLFDEPEKPEIEKYINYAVHKDIDLDETFTYDILAWVTTDADTVTITDTLNEKIIKADDVVTVLDIGKDNNHKVERNKQGTVVNTDATVAVAGGVPVAGAEPVWNGKTLTVTIPDATANRGHWVNVRFNVKLDISDTKEDGTKKTKIEKLAEAEAFYEFVSAGAVDETRDEPNKGNDPVKSEEDHNGVPNTASYDIGVRKVVYDENGNVVRDENGNVVVEENPTPGYSDESNTVTVKPVIPKLDNHDVEISKNSLGGTEIEGAHIKLTGTDANGESFKDEWTSETEPHIVKLAEGTYTMVETVAPEGYQQVTTEMVFTVNAEGIVTLETVEVDGGGKISIKEGTTNHIVLEDAPVDKKPVEIIKKDLATKNALVGAGLQLTDESGKIIKEWNSGNDPESISLVPGTYTLTEIKVPYGYNPADPIVFVVDENGYVDNTNSNSVEMFDAPKKINEFNEISVNINKKWTDKNGNETEWPDDIKVEFTVEYYDKYTKKFELYRPDDPVKVVLTKDQPSIVIDDLDYVLDGSTAMYRAVETKIDGYKQATTTSTNLDAGVGLMEAINVPDVPGEESFEVLISKNALGGSEIPGAQMKIFDAAGNVVCEWTSTTEAYKVTLKPGSYTMVEEVAPAGYQKVTTAITFTIDAKGGVILGTATVDNGGRIKVMDGNHIVLEDAPEKKTEEEGGKSGTDERRYTPNIPGTPYTTRRVVTTPSTTNVSRATSTGDNNNTVLWIVMAAAAAAVMAGMALVIRRRKNGDR